VIIERATIDDAFDILTLQKLAYQSEAEIYHDDTIPPLIQTLDHLKSEFQHFLLLKLTVDGAIIGSVRALHQKDTCYIAKLFVHPDFQNLGYGKALMQEIEKAFPDSKRFELFTAHMSKRNLYLYEKLGYTEFRHEEITPDMTLIFLEKIVLYHS
jgi:ribosomal protein S18 acetylase RimI-like enzyme